jgi:hypothetical protein
MFTTIFPSWIRMFHIHICPIETWSQLNDSAIILRIFHVLNYPCVYAWIMIVLHLVINTNTLFMFEGHFTFSHISCIPLSIGEGPEYRPFCNLRSVPEPGTPLREQVTSHGRACTRVLFLHKAELGFFSLFMNSDRLAGTFCWSEDPSTAWLIPSTA